MICNSCLKKLKLILGVNTKIFACENKKCDKYGFLVCEPYSYMDETLEEIFKKEKK